MLLFSNSANRPTCLTPLEQGAADQPDSRVEELIVKPRGTENAIAQSRTTAVFSTPEVFARDRAHGSGGNLSPCAPLRSLSERIQLLFRHVIPRIRPRVAFIRLRTASSQLRSLLSS